MSPHLTIGSKQETVVVKERMPGLDTTSAAIATNLDEDAIHGLPSNGRRWSDFALLTPTVTSDQQGYGMLSFRGISALMNNNTMDGADNNQAFFSEERGRSTIAYSTSESSVREFQVNASNYSAEYGPRSRRCRQYGYPQRRQQLSWQQLFLTIATASGCSESLYANHE